MVKKYPQGYETTLLPRTTTQMCSIFEENNKKQGKILENVPRK
jgi:hypothetical protein